MSLSTERACPLCGLAAVERALHQVLPELCPRCRFAQGLERARALHLKGARYCPFCDREIEPGYWALHEGSKMHRLYVRIHFAGVLERAQEDRASETA